DKLVLNARSRYIGIENYIFISCIDIIWEAIQQLHRVIRNTKKIPFEGSSEIFQEEVDDNNHFKHIRAVFGAHSVNLNDKYDKDNKRYASWPTSKLEQDLSVFLYSLEPSKNDITFSIKFTDLIDFVRIRYNYLDSLANRIEDQYEEFLNKMKKSKIFKKDDPFEQIELLKREATKRFGECDYLVSLLDKIYGTLLIECTNYQNYEKVNEYIYVLKDALEDVRINLQNMDIENLELYEIFSNNYPQEIDFQMIRLDDPRHFASHYSFRKKIKSFLKDYIVFTDDLEYEEESMLIDVGLHFYRKDNP
ncbi:MAG: hypothetical protein ACLFSQ_05035, partial [Candidatus Zixiibacteriota bacterium]